MKKQKSAERFVDDIIKDLPLSPYTPRFREELLEHINDAEEDLIDRNENNISEKIMQKIGDKNTLTESYVDFYRNSLSALWPIELIVYIALSPVLWFVTCVIMFAYDSITNDSLWILKLIVIAFSFLIAYAFNHIVFNFAAKRLSPHVGNKKRRILTALSLVVVPTFYMISMISWQSPHSISTLLEFLANIVLVLAPIYIANGIAFGIIPQKNKKTSAGNTKTPYLLLFIFLATLLGSIPLAQKKTGMPFLMFPDTISTPWQFLDAIVSLVTIPISLFYYLAGSLSIFIKLDTPTTFKIFGALLVIVAVGGIWLITIASKAKTKNDKSWKRATGIALVAYAAFILLPINKTPTTSGLSIPSFDVTKKIEQNQMGLLYPAYEYLNYTTIGIFYTACREGNLFTVTQGSGNKESYFLIDVTNVPEGQTPIITAETRQGRGECTQEFFLYGDNYPQGFECPNCKKDIQYDDIGNVTSFSLDLTNLAYNGHKLLNKDFSSGIREIKVSDNREWALFELNADQIRLVDLRKLR